MKLINKIGIVSAVVFSIGVIATTTQEENSDILEEKVVNEIFTCDGVNITENCELNGEMYDKYIFHPSTEEISHYESKIVGYNTIIVGYCTLCNDGTRSPSCSTGRGTCSHHGGVKEWNAPIYKEEAIYEDVKIIDQPAKSEWYEIIKSN